MVSIAGCNVVNALIHCMCGAFDCSAFCWHKLSVLNPHSAPTSYRLNSLLF
jgi:hypothetical protein